MKNIAGLSFDFSFSFSSYLWLQQHLSKGISSSQHSVMEPVLICKKKLLKGNTPFAAQFGMFFTSFNSGPNNLRCTWSNHFVLELPKTFVVHAQYASCLASAMFMSRNQKLLLFIKKILQQSLFDGFIIYSFKKLCFHK